MLRSAEIDGRRQTSIVVQRSKIYIKTGPPHSKRIKRITQAETQDYFSTDEEEEGFRNKVKGAGINMERKIDFINFGMDTCENGQ